MGQAQPLPKAASDVDGDVGFEEKGHVMMDHRLVYLPVGVEEN